ncbi:MAG: MFS transporter [Candidatus Wallbacteria bacterium]
MREKLIVLLSFILIFSFSAVDNAIAPMVKTLHSYYSVDLEKVIWLISYCTFGILFGIVIGPAFIASFNAKKVIASAAIGMSAMLALFLLTPQFLGALLFRTLFGIFLGVAASSMWWITYYGVNKHYYQAMVIVLMSARPLALALGVPAAGLIAANYDWRYGFYLFLGLIALSGLTLTFSLQGDSQAKEKFSPFKIITEYINAFKVKNLTKYYSGMVLNRMCYFGFYSFQGVWFIKHYNASLESISQALFFIGLAETAINFAAPALLKKIGAERLFTISIISSGVIFAIFIQGVLSFYAAVFMIALFMVLDRLYVVTSVIAIPEMFAEAQNKTIFGSLNTLTAWLGLGIISWIQGRFTNEIGISAMQNLLLLSFIAGSALIYKVQYETVFSKNK